MSFELVPTEILTEIFSQLPIKNLGRCSQVCTNWHHAFEDDYSWRTFEYRDGIFVRRRFTQHSGWQYHIDHMRLKYLISNAIRKWRNLIIRPVTNLFNLYEFFRVITAFTDFYERTSENDRPLAKVRNFNFQWRLHIEADENDATIRNKDFGTGGEMLHKLANIIKHLHGLQSLTLADLQLSHWEADKLILELLEQFSNQLRYLSLLNLTLVPKQYMHVGLFLNLRKLLVSPQMLDANSLSLIACLRHLESFLIIQDEKSGRSPSADGTAWKLFTAHNNGRTKVWLILRGKPKTPLIIQPNAPVYGIKMEKCAGQLTIEIAEQISNYYNQTLIQFVQCGLERMKRGKKMCERVDHAIIDIVTRCRFLEVISCRERMSHGTALILAVLAEKRKFKLFLRQNALLRRICYRTKDMAEYDMNFDYVKKNCATQELLIECIKSLTNQSWPILTDKMYKSLHQN